MITRRQMLGAGVGVAGGGLAWAAGLRPSLAAEPPVLRLGLLAGGTASWEVDTLLNSPSLRDGLAVKLEVLPMANPQAGKVALLGGSVDAIVSDWLGAARSHREQLPLQFLPYSCALGSLISHPQAAISSVEQLVGKRLGIAGGGLDKSWLLLRAYARARGIDLEQQATLAFGAPPLLSVQAAQGDLDAVLTYWPYAVRLQQAGFTPVLSVDAMAQALSPNGSAGAVPWLGYVVTQAWSQQNPAALRSFYQAIVAARRLLRDRDEAWSALAPQMKAESEAVAVGLRAAWRAGIPAPWGEAEKAAIIAQFGALCGLGGEALCGSVTRLDPGFFAPVSLTRESDVQWQE